MAQVHHETITHEANRFRVWQQLRRHNGNLTLEDIARLTGLSISTVSRIVPTLRIARKPQTTAGPGRIGLRSDLTRVPADLFMRQAHISEGARIQSRDIL